MMCILQTNMLKIGFDLKKSFWHVNFRAKLFFLIHQRYTYRVLQTIQMKLILLFVLAERAFLGSAKAALKFNYEI